MLQTLQIATMLLGTFGLGYLLKFYLNESLNKQINDLRAQVDSLSTQLEWSADEKNKLIASLATANAELLEAKNELTEKQNALTSAQGDAEQLQSKADSLELENSLAAENLASLREQLQADGNTTVEQLDRIERLHAELNKVKGDNTVLLNEKEKLNNSISEFRNKLQGAENNLLLTSSQSDAERAIFEQLKDENAAALEAIATLKEHAQLNEKTIIDQITRIEQLQDELNRIKEESYSTATALQTDYDRLNEENTELKNNAGALEMQLELLTNEVEESKDIILALQIDNGELLVDIMALEENAGQIVNSNNEEVEAQLELLTNEVEKNEEIILGLQIDNGELLVDIMALEENTGQVLNNNEEFDAQLELLINEIEQKNNAILALQMDKGELLVDVMSLEESTGMALNISEDFEAKLLQLQNEKGALERSVVELLRENEEMMTQMATLYETEVNVKEAANHPVQIEDEIEVEEHEAEAPLISEIEIATPEMSEAEVLTPEMNEEEHSTTIMSESELSAPAMAESEMDNDDVIPDDLKLVEGIGPKIQELLYNSGIKTFQRLSTTPVEHIRRILVLAGDRFAVHDPKSWPEQALLAADGKWDELQKFQAHLAAEAEKVENRQG